MADRAVRVELAAAGGAPTVADGVLHEYASGERLRRAAAIAAVAVVLAASLLVIPIIHFLAPPLLLVCGTILAIRQLRATARLRPVRVPCPKCGAANRIGGGLGLTDPGAALVHRCEACRRDLTLTITPA